ncbi:PEGA domain-containing protein [Patescibacteria group bacterium]|nr:PEGA domain-containing protein [Patescibacteria group bacterium]
MSQTAQKTLIFITMLVLIGLVIAWFTVLNTGSITITTGLDSYTIYTDYEPIFCEKDPCTIKLESGNYQVRFEKDEYNTITTKATVIRFKDVEVVFTPKKAFKLELINIVPGQEKSPVLPAPSGIDIENVITSMWNEDRDKFLFLDKSDNRLKIIDKSDKITLITKLTNIKPPFDLYWSPSENLILGNQDQDLYFIEVDEGSRKKQIADFTPIAVLWSPQDDFILLNDDQNNLYKINWTDRITEKLDLVIDLNESVWIDDTTLITYSINEEKNQTTIWTFDFKQEIREDLIQRFDFPINKIDYDLNQNLIYVHNSRESAWYEINLN